MECLDQRRVLLTYEMPLSELIIDLRQAEVSHQAMGAWTTAHRLRAADLVGGRY